MLPSLTGPNRSQGNVLFVADGEEYPAGKDRARTTRPVILTFTRGRDKLDTHALSQKYGVEVSNAEIIAIDLEREVGSHISAAGTDEITIDGSDPATVVDAIDTWLAAEIHSIETPIIYVDSLEVLVRTVNFEEALAVLRALTDWVTQIGGVGYYVGRDLERDVIDVLSPIFDTVERRTATNSSRVKRSVASVGTGAGGGGHAQFVIDPLLDVGPGLTQSWTPALWLLAVLTFGLGDILTTIVGLQMNIIVEASPVAAQIIGANGLGFIYVVKLATFVMFYLLWRFSPAPHRIGIPLGLGLLGVVVTTWNLSVIVAALPY